MHVDIKTSRVVAITGGSKGIGFHLGEAFFQAGYLVALAARSACSIDVSNFGGRVLCFDMDVRNREDHMAFTNFVLENFGKLDVYINNAGRSEWRALPDIDDIFLKEILEVNLHSCFWGAQAAASAFESRGVILNIGSIAGKRGSANNSAYAAAKFGVTGLTQSLAKELGRKGVRVNSVCPVLVKTEGLIDAIERKDGPAAGIGFERFLEQFAESQSSLGFLPSTIDVSNMCLFLASDASQAITGQNFNVDCGVFPQ